VEEGRSSLYLIVVFSNDPWGVGRAQSEKARVKYNSFRPGNPGRASHPGSLATDLHPGPDHLLLRQPFQLRLFPFTDATPPSPRLPALSP
jgi:hypothetical protein